MFRVDNGERKRELFEKFREASNNYVLTQCLINRTEYGSVYPPDIEERMDQIVSSLDLEHSEPPWLHLLD